MTQTDQDFLQHDAGSAPETNSSYPAHVNQDDSDSNSSDQGNSDDDALDKFEDFFQNLRIRMRSTKNERNALDKGGRLRIPMRRGVALHGDWSIKPLANRIDYKDDTGLVRNTTKKQEIMNDQSNRF